MLLILAYILGMENKHHSNRTEAVFRLFHLLDKWLQNPLE